MGRWNGKTDQWLDFYGETSETITTPRGFGRHLIGLCNRYGVSYQFDDQRRELPEVDFEFHGSLRPFQVAAVEDMLKNHFGTLSAPTGSGKTVMGLWMVAERKQPTLIIVHTKELLNQWVDRIETFLGIPKSEVGIIGAGKKQVGDKITVALVQSLYKVAGQVSPHIGHLACDECHRCPSRTFTEAVTAFDSKYMLGLSATPYRRDRLSRLIFWFLGDVVHTVDKDQLIENGDILRAEVITRETDFRPFHDSTTEYSKMLSELTQDPGRNRLIAADVAMEAGNGGGICLILSDRKAHAEVIQNVLRGFGVRSELLTGDVPKKQREAVVEKLNQGKAKVVCATGQLIGEGFDCRGLSTLFMATPIRFSGRVIQYLGRVLRPAPGKSTATVYDYVDVNVGPLVAAAKARQRIYDV